jgi:4-amino-4-deoxy-L-arabinose transferase-like glycosyltransferase
VDRGASSGRPWVGPRAPWSPALDGILAAAVGAATLLSRLADASTSLYTVDSVLFSLGTERYDLLALRPHAPGYPIFVAMGKALLPLVGHDANRAFTLEAALWSGLAVALLYALARTWGSRRAALACALLFAVAPAFAFNGTIALSYTAEAAAMVGVALAAGHAWRQPTPARLVALGAGWALAVGIRQSLLLFLAPMVAVALLGPAPRQAGGRVLARRVGIAAAAAVTLALSWLIPTVQATGGLAAFRHATRAQSQQVVLADAVWARGWPALLEHVDRLAWFLHWEGPVLLPVLAACILLGFAVRRRPGAAAEQAAWPGGAGLMLAAWLVPATAFYLVVFDGWQRGPIGYVLTVLPGLYLAAVLLADHGLRRLAAAQPPRLARIVTALSLLILLVPLPSLTAQANDLVAHEAHANDAWTAEWQKLATEYPANDTAILTWQSWAHVEWYFPDHLAWTYFPSYRIPGQPDWAMIFAMQHHEQEGRFVEMYEQGPGRPLHPIPANIRTIVLFDFQLAGENGEARRLDPALNVTEAHLADGWRILVLHPDAAHRTVESLFTPAALGQGARGSA